jgi:hypothetical protein
LKAQARPFEAGRAGPGGLLRAFLFVRAGPGLIFKKFYLMKIKN